MGFCWGRKRSQNATKQMANATETIRGCVEGVREASDRLPEMPEEVTRTISQIYKKTAAVSC